MKYQKRKNFISLVPFVIKIIKNSINFIGFVFSRLIPGLKHIIQISLINLKQFLIHRFFDYFCLFCYHSNYQMIDSFKRTKLYQI